MQRLVKYPHHYVAKTLAMADIKQTKHLEPSGPVKFGFREQAGNKVAVGSCSV